MRDRNVGPVSRVPVLLQLLLLLGPTPMERGGNATLSAGGAGGCMIEPPSSSRPRSQSLRERRLWMSLGEEQEDEGGEERRKLNHRLRHREAWLAFKFCAIHQGLNFEANS